MSKIILEVEHLGEELEKMALQHLFCEPYQKVKKIIEELKNNIIARDSTVHTSIGSIPETPATSSTSVV